MPTYVVKPDRDSGDFYVIWSTVVESPLAFGPRAFLREWAATHGRHQEATDDQFTRADAVGSSAMWPDAASPYLRFGEGMIYEQRGWLPRENLTALCVRLDVDEQDRVVDLLTPFDGETEVRP